MALKHSQMNKLLAIFVFFASPLILQAYPLKMQNLISTFGKTSRLSDNKVAIIIIDHGSRVSKANDMLLEVSKAIEIKF